MMTRRYLTGKLLLIIAFCVTVLACKDGVGEGVIERELMTDILFDYHLALAVNNNLMKENYERALTEQYVFRKHGITEAQFDSSMVWYTRHTQILVEMYKQVSDRMKEEQLGVDKLISIRDQRPMTSASGDTVDVWAWRRMVRLSQACLDNVYSFVLPSDSNFHATDSLVWEVNCRLLPENQKKSDAKVLMQMFVRYEPDTVKNAIAEISLSGRKNITVQCDGVNRIKEVCGMLILQADSTERVAVVDSIRLMRYHVIRNCQTDSLGVAVKDTVETKKVEPIDVKHVAPKTVAVKEQKRVSTNKRREVRFRSQQSKKEEK